jgi:methylmalonyl-CoA mutase cobalamin-binding subunit
MTEGASHHKVGADVAQHAVSGCGHLVLNGSLFGLASDI